LEEWAHIRPSLRAEPRGDEGEYGRGARMGKGREGGGALSKKRLSKR